MSTQLVYTFSTLTQAIQTWLDDNDSDWTGAVPLSQVVGLAEMRVIMDMDLTVFDAAASVNYTVVGAGLITRPATLFVVENLGYLVPTLLKYKPIERRTVGWILDYQDPAVLGPPKYYAEYSTTQIILAPFADQTYALAAFGPAITASLNDAPTATWLSTNAPEVLFAAALIEVSIVLKNAARQQVAMTEYMAKLAVKKAFLRPYLRSRDDVLRGLQIEQAPGLMPGEKPTPE